MSCFRFLIAGLALLALAACSRPMDPAAFRQTPEAMFLLDTVARLQQHDYAALSPRVDPGLAAQLSQAGLEHGVARHHVQLLAHRLAALVRRYAVAEPNNFGKQVRLERPPVVLTHAVLVAGTPLLDLRLTQLVLHARLHGRRRERWRRICASLY